MDRSEARLDIIEGQNFRYFDKNMRESTEFSSELLANLRFSDFFSFPGVYVPMSPEIYSAVSDADEEQTCLEMIRSYGTPMACLKSDQGDSVLHLAAAWGRVELVKSIVLECPCLLLEPDSNDRLPIHVAAHGGHVAVVKSLVETIKFVSATLSTEDKEKLNIYVAKDINGDTPLHLALRVTRTETAESLVYAYQQASFLPNKNGITPLYMAVEAGFVSIVKEMLKSTDNDGPDLQLQGRKCLVHAALKARNTDLLDIVLKVYASHEEERDEEGQTCLSFGASIGFVQGVKMLLRQSTKSVYVSNEDGSFPIHIAVEKGHTTVVMAIVKSCPKSIYLLNKHAQNILHIASKSGKVSYVLFCYLWELRSMNELMEKQDLDGNTPVHLATIKWHPRTLFLLLNYHKGNCMFIRNNEGQTPLDVAESNMKSHYIYMERITLMVLYMNTTSKRDYQEMSFRKKMTRTNAPSVKDAQAVNYAPVVDNKEQYINTLLVVAALVATVTFAAGFTIPGGFNSSGPYLGSATLANDVKLICFLVFDILAMLFSILTIVTLICGQLGDPALVQRSLDAALPYLFYALLCMPVAFYCGVYIAFAHVKGILIFLLVTSVIFGYLILTFLGPHVILKVPGVAPLIGQVFKIFSVVVGQPLQLQIRLIELNKSRIINQSLKIIYKQM